MTSPADRLSPRQLDCLRLVWERQALSKEIATELGISKGRVDNAIAEAVARLGARDRRDAARMVFGDRPRAEYTVHPAAVAASPADEASSTPSTEVSAPSRPWRTRERPYNTLTFAQTIGWVAIIAVGSIVALAAATSIGAGLPRLWWPILQAFRRLTH